MWEVRVMDVSRVPEEGKIQRADTGNNVTDIYSIQVRLVRAYGSNRLPKTRSFFALLLSGLAMYHPNDCCYPMNESQYAQLQEEIDFLPRIVNVVPEVFSGVDAPSSHESMTAWLNHPEQMPHHCFSLQALVRVEVDLQGIAEYFTYISERTGCIFDSTAYDDGPVSIDWGTVTHVEDCRAHADLWDPFVASTRSCKELKAQAWTARETLQTWFDRVGAAPLTKPEIQKQFVHFFDVKVNTCSAFYSLDNIHYGHQSILAKCIMSLVEAIFDGGDNIDEQGLEPLHATWIAYFEDAFDTLTQIYAVCSRFYVGNDWKTTHDNEKWVAVFTGWRDHGFEAGAFKQGDAAAATQCIAILKANW